MNQKDWGRAFPLVETSQCRIVRIEIEPNWYCSKHFHERQSNAFYVLSGILEIECWDKDGYVTARLLTKRNPHCTIPAGVVHRFFSHSPVEALEIYRGECSVDDIVRLEPGKRCG